MMVDASPSEENISAELRRLGGNVLGALRVAWKRPERQEAGRVFKHQLYSVLKISNRELEKVIQTLSPNPGPLDGGLPPDPAATSGLGGQAGTQAVARPDTAAPVKSKEG